MDCRFKFLTLLAATACVAFARAEPPPLLDEAAKKWAAGTDEWAFTQRVRTFDDDKVKLERLERYDPSRPDSQRWELLEIDGKPPTAAERERWQHRKNRKPKRKSEGGTLEKYFDFDHATVAKETPTVVRYNVPLRKDATWLVSLDKVEVEVAVDKATRSIEQITGGLREPLRLALGLAKITDVSLDVRFDPLLHDLTPDEEGPPTSGAVHVVVFKMGDRAEYSWSQFKHVTPASPAKTEAPRAKEAPASGP